MYSTHIACIQHLWHLARLRALVASELALVARVDNDAVDPVRVAQVCALQQELVGGERELLGVTRTHGHVGVERVDRCEGMW